MAAVEAVKRRGVVARLATVILTLLVSSVVSLLLAEGAVRVLWPQTTYGGGVGYLDFSTFDLAPSFSGQFTHPDYRYSATTDARRLRRTDNGPPADGATAVLMLGDSFTFGIGVDDNQTIASHLSRALRSAGHQVVVENAGVPNYTLAESACKYERLRGVQPRVVIVTAVFNDFFANLGPCSELYGPGTQRAVGIVAVNTTWQRFYPKIRDLALGHSQLAVLSAIALNNVLVKFGMRSSVSAMAAPYDPSSYSTHADRTRNVADVLSRLRATIEGDGASAVFLYIPGVLETSDELWQASQHEQGGRLDRGLPRRFLLDAARGAGFATVVDPTDAAGGQRLQPASYFPLDMHLNASGTKTVGELAARTIAPLVAARRRPI